MDLWLQSRQNCGRVVKGPHGMQSYGTRIVIPSVRYSNICGKKSYEILFSLSLSILRLPSIFKSYWYQTVTLQRLLAVADFLSAGPGFRTRSKKKRWWRLIISPAIPVTLREIQRGARDFVGIDHCRLGLYRLWIQVHRDEMGNAQTSDKHNFPV